MADLMTGASGYQTGSIDTATAQVNNTSPHNANHINGVSAGIIQIETILGLGTTLKGAATDLVARLSVLLDTDGTLKLTGFKNLVAGDTLYATSSTAMTRLAKGTAGQVFQMNTGATAPIWGGGVVPSNPTSIGTGSTQAHEGTVTISSNQNLSGIHFYTDFTINSGIVVTVPTGFSGGYALAIVATGTVTINGTITAAGSGQPGGAGGTSTGTGGNSGGAGASGTDQPGSGGGGGGAGIGSNGGSGATGPSALQHGTAWAAGGAGGTAGAGAGGVGGAGPSQTGSIVARMCFYPVTSMGGCGGSGGGGSGGDGATGVSGGAGGAGGGSILIIAPTIVLAGSSTLNTSGSAGAAGTTGGTSQGGGGGGGGGSAGNVAFQCHLYTNNGATFTLTGGSGGAGGGSGGGGASAGGAGGAGADGIKEILLFN